MSKGYCGFADLIQAGDLTVEYHYCCFNINMQGWEAYKQSLDGIILIQRDAFVEPAVTTKIVRRAGGRKKPVTKRIPRPFSVAELLQAEKAIVKYASGTWYTIDGIDYVASRILEKIFGIYQETGDIPSQVVWIV